MVIGTENWSTRFEKRGFHTTKGLMYGFWRENVVFTSSDQFAAYNISKLDWVKYYYGYRGPNCQEIDWREKFDGGLNSTQVSCPVTTALKGLERSECAELSCIESAYCCSGVSETCYTQDIHW
eukprot:UN26398